MLEGFGSVTGQNKREISGLSSWNIWWAACCGESVTRQGIGGKPTSYDMVNPTRHTGNSIHDLQTERTNRQKQSRENLGPAL
ncbi:hypothetical protein [Bacillus sonorensis]|uniref:hypothetical protein n=1 Tax=Bacillus sonorensis TaxID=119858 RepID=UPI001F401573|nr:hypothetical protein [Bacillus sonorensis]MCF7616120.1 hypothetical protein [Bacillus sonorensis]MCY7857953.1 hypothetical protein [Bacillus sonorensis]MCY8033309.1 hypothetical protein [Bacillus sonorensis]MCY8089078.1 hypothetical protein [Bacillus sonorensis]MCY8269939.1 hypothetical protein [Bacillus sonorensis]